jgi:hypothetical protein
MRGTPILGIFLVFISTQAHALCKDEVQELQPRIEQLRLKNNKADHDRYGLAKQWSDLALIEGTTGDEMDCRTYLIRAQRVLRPPLEEANPAAEIGGPAVPVGAIQPNQKFTPPGAAPPKGN